MDWRNRDKQIHDTRCSYFRARPDILSINLSDSGTWIPTYKVWAIEEHSGNNRERNAWKWTRQEPFTTASQVRIMNESDASSSNWRGNSHIAESNFGNNQKHNHLSINALEPNSKREKRLELEQNGFISNHFKKLTSSSKIHTWIPQSSFESNIN